MCILSHPLIKQACSKVGRIFYYMNLRNFPPCFVFFILFKNWNKLIYIIILCSGVQQLFDKWMISSRADCYKKVELNKIPEVQLTLEQVRSQGSANAGWDPRAQAGHGWEQRNASQVIYDCDKMSLICMVVWKIRGKGELYCIPLKGQLESEDIPARLRVAG